MVAFTLAAASPANTVSTAGNTLDLTQTADVQVGSLLLALAMQKEGASSTAITCVTTGHGFTKAGEKLSTKSGVVQGVDTGNTRVAAFWQQYDSDTQGPLFSFAGQNGPDVMWGRLYSIATEVPVLWDVALAAGEDTTGDASWSAVLSTIDLAPGDICVVASTIPTDITTPAQFTAEAITAPGFTFGAMTEFDEPDTSAGNDLGGFAFYQEVATGSGTATPTVTATVAATVTNVYGPTILVRFRPTVILADRTASTRIYTNASPVLADSTVPAKFEGWGQALYDGPPNRVPVGSAGAGRFYVNVT